MNDFLNNLSNINNVNNDKLLVEFENVMRIDVGSFLKLYLAKVIEIPKYNELVDYVIKLEDISRMFDEKSGVDLMIKFWKAFEMGNPSIKFEDLKKGD